MEPLSDDVRTCTRIIRFNECLVVLLELVAALFMSLRLYAIWSTNRWVFIGIFVLGLVEPICNIYNFSAMHIVSIPNVVGCGQYAIPSNTHAVFLSKFGPSWAIGSHGLVLVLTWVKTAGIAWTSMQLKMKTSMGYLLLRDGSVYFVLLFILNIFLALQPVSALNTAAGAMADVAVSILISHFIINLRRVYFFTKDETWNGPSMSSTLLFTRTLTGNLGAPLSLPTSIPAETGRNPGHHPTVRQLRKSLDLVAVEEWVEDASEENGRVTYAREPILVGLSLSLGETSDEFLRSV
ncbi:hypothetical protein BXZ70DRAFT_963946 [Cristinia sonorae]|uniref:Uncharacterized protein n=1 Tax=Cristinia sonorae TaxID=1940300 RepID=A0A8K0UCH9_9AGAR|nr:hypothetical protein BXZ70DRAFT_963946 [Cristinia sonorae]